VLRLIFDCTVRIFESTAYEQKIKFREWIRQELPDLIVENLTGGPGSLFSHTVYRTGDLTCQATEATSNINVIVLMYPTTTHGVLEMYATNKYTFDWSKPVTVQNRSYRDFAPRKDRNRRCVQHNKRASVCAKCRDARILHKSTMQRCIKSHRTQNGPLPHGSRTLQAVFIFV